MSDAIKENPEAVVAFVERLDAVNELLDVVELGTAAMDDGMATTLARTGSNLGGVADAASDPDAVRGLETVLGAVGEASDPDDPPEPVGALGLLRALRDPEVRRGLGFLLGVARATGRELDE